jgi:hypothetical protein
VDLKRPAPAPVRPKSPPNKNADARVWMSGPSSFLEAPLLVRIVDPIPWPTSPRLIDAAASVRLHNKRRHLRCSLPKEALRQACENIIDSMNDSALIISLIVSLFNIKFCRRGSSGHRE